MDSVVHFLESVVRYTAEIGITLVEIAGIIVLLTTAGKCFVHYLQKQQHIALELAQGTALALEFKLGGEVLRTVLARDMSELLVLGIVIILRAALTVLLHWEIKNEMNEHHLLDLTEE